MKKLTKKDKRSELRKEYDNAVLLLRTYPTESDMYAMQLKTVERLHKLLMEEEDRREKLSLDTVLTCITSGLSVGAILHHEKVGVITSKALQFVLKGRR